MRGLQHFFSFSIIVPRYSSPVAQTYVIIGSFNVTWADTRIIVKVRSADSAEKRNIDCAPCRIGRIFPCDARRCNVARCIQHPRSGYRTRNATIASVKSSGLPETMEGQRERERKLWRSIWIHFSSQERLKWFSFFTLFTVNYFFHRILELEH